MGLSTTCLIDKGKEIRVETGGRLMKGEDATFVRDPSRKAELRTNAASAFHSH